MAALIRAGLGLGFAALALGGLAAAQGGLVSRVSVDSGGTEATGGSHAPALTPDARFVAFTSDATDLVPGDTNGWRDVFVHDRQTGLTERVSVSTAGVQGNGDSDAPAISADGRYVVFMSLATNLVAADTNQAYDVFLRDRASGTTTRISTNPGGAQANSDSLWPAISADGNLVAFDSFASNLILGDTNGTQDVFVKNRGTGAVERVSVSATGIQSNSDSVQASISADGRFVAFTSNATNLVAADTNAMGDVFLRDRQAHTTERISVSSSGAQASVDSSNAIVSPDGRFVAFASAAANLVAGDSNGFTDVFLRDRTSGLTERLSLDSSGAEANDFSLPGPISADGRFVVFSSYASNLVAGDTNADFDAFRRDRIAGRTERISLDSNGVEADGWNWAVVLSPDGRFAAFESASSNLIANDTNLVFDVFVKDLGSAEFTSLCEPGSGGVVACPCANPPSGAGRGCDNSSSTGGALLWVTGQASLQNDTLVLLTSGEKPTATSVVLQGNSLSAGGIPFGQGVRCASGVLKRLYVRPAVNGSIQVPGTGDASVSARSAALGDTIPFGQSRWYLVYYRDPVVLGGCFAVNTFNATQTGRIDWTF